MPQWESDSSGSPRQRFGSDVDRVAVFTRDHRRQLRHLAEHLHRRQARRQDRRHKDQIHDALDEEGRFGWNYGKT